MWEIVKSGGIFMVPIILCSIILVGIVFERLWTLQRKRVLPQELIKKVSQLAEANQVNAKVIDALEKNSPLGRVLAAALANRDRGRAIMMERVEDTGRHVVHELERFVNSVGTIASIAPLLGLLGTVTGIINAFKAVMLGGMGDPRMLAQGISEALVCTAGGLTVTKEPGTGVGKVTQLLVSYDLRVIDQAKGREIHMGCIEKHIGKLGMIWAETNRPTPEKIASRDAFMDQCMVDKGFDYVVGRYDDIVRTPLDDLRPHGSPEWNAYFDCSDATVREFGL